MEFQEVVSRRRMVRNYSGAPVDPESIERILAAARRAPSAGFSQGQSFVVVTEESTRRKIADLAGEPHYVEQGFDPWVSRAPVHVIVCTSEATYHQRYREPDKIKKDGTEIEWPVPYWYVDAGASMMLLLLTAVDEGLAAGFLGFRGESRRELAALLDLPHDVSIVGMVTIGHPAEDRRSGSLKRGWKPEDEVIHRERWE